MERIDPVNHCDHIGACGKPSLTRSNYNKIDTDITARGEEGLCSVCEQMVQQAKDSLTDPESINQIKRKLENLCEFLKVIDQNKQCEQQVDNYLDMALEFVKQIKPRDYCAAIHLCVPAVNIYDYRPQLADFNRFGIETSVDIKPKTKLVTQMAKGSPNCILCKTVVKELFKVLRNNKTEANIRNELDKVCNVIFHHHPDKAEECSQMVEAYSRQLLEFLIDETDPDMICILIDQCVPKSKPSLGNLISILRPDQSSSIETCLECKMFVKYLRDKMDKPQTKETVKNYLLTQLCDKLGDENMKKTCSDVVDTYADEIFDVIVNDLDPQKACVIMDACKSAKPGQLERVITTELFRTIEDRNLSPLIDVETNRVCKEIVDQISSYLSKEVYGQDVDVGLLMSKACNQVSKLNRSQCKELVSDTSSFIKLLGLLDGKSSEEICGLSAY